MFDFQVSNIDAVTLCTSQNESPMLRYDKSDAASQRDYGPNAPFCGRRKYTIRKLHSHLDGSSISVGTNESSQIIQSTARLDLKKQHTEYSMRKIKYRPK